MSRLDAIVCVLIVITCIRRQRSQPVQGHLALLSLQKRREDGLPPPANMASSTTPLLRAAAVRNAVAQNARMAPRYTRQASGHGAATASAEQYPTEGGLKRLCLPYRQELSSSCYYLTLCLLVPPVFVDCRLSHRSSFPDDHNRPSFKSATVNAMH